MNSSMIQMNSGSISKNMIRFAFPLFIGNLLQQLYNIVDSLIVGNIEGTNALAAITSTGSLTFLLIGFFQGVFSGASVIISKYFGANEREQVQKAVHTAVAFGLTVSVILTFLGVLFTPSLLRLLGTPANVLPGATTYMRIYFSGIASVILYNTANGIYQAMGDSKHPLHYLIISSITNVLLDLLFVGLFRMGVAGAAFATVLSQGVSTVLAFYRLMKTNEVYQVRLRKLRFEKRIVSEILRIGIPSGIQNSVIGLANTVVQANINSFGSLAVAGCGSYSKIEGFVFIPIVSFSMAITTFVSQNLGARQYDRAKKGATFGIISACGIAALIGIIFYLFAPTFISLFGTDASSIEIGVKEARIITLFYTLLAFSHSTAGVLRGAGKSIIPMFIMLGSWCLLRVTYVTTMLHFIPKIQVIFWAYPLTWTVSSIAFLGFLVKSDWVHGLEIE
ncbi:MAG: MATE family efflux transporter [bacterium]|nr:MATE family efflux transporter [bacterium]